MLNNVKKYKWLQVYKSNFFFQLLDYCENPTNAAFYLFVVRNVIFIALVIHGAACFWFKIACNGFDQVDGTNGTKIVVNKCEQGTFIFLSWFYFLFSIFINIIYLGVDAPTQWKRNFTRLVSCDQNIGHNYAYMTRKIQNVHRFRFLNSFGATKEKIRKIQNIVVTYFGNYRSLKTPFNLFTPLY